MSGTKVYASALVVLGAAALLHVVSAVVHGAIITVPGAGIGPHLLHWFHRVAGLTVVAVIAMLLVLIAMQYFRERLELPACRPARIGAVLSGIGLAATAVFVAWQVAVYLQGPQASIFQQFGPAGFWLSFLVGGAVLVEGSRILESARPEPQEPCFHDTEFLENRCSR